MPTDADHTVDPSVLPAPSPVHYDLDAPEKDVTEFDTGLIMIIPPQDAQPDGDGKAEGERGR